MFCSRFLLVDFFSINQNREHNISFEDFLGHLRDPRVTIILVTVILAKNNGLFGNQPYVSIVFDCSSKNGDYFPKMIIFNGKWLIYTQISYLKYVYQKKLALTKKEVEDDLK